MNILSTITITLVALGGLSLAGCQDSRQSEAQPKAYPFKKCVVGGEQLGSMGPVLSEVKDGYEYKFCCPECKTKFDKMPTPYVKEVHDAFIPMPESP